MDDLKEIIELFEIIGGIYTVISLVFSFFNGTFI